MNFLSDAWCANGTSYEDLIEQIKYMDGHTTVYKTCRSDIGLLSVDKEAMKGDGIIPLLLHKGEERQLPSRTSYSMTKALENGHDECLFDEMIRSSGSMLSLRERYCLYLSRNAFRDIGARCSVGGDSIYIPSITRDAYLTYLLQQDKDKCVNLVIKNCGNAKKVFAMPSAGYQYIQQKTLLDIIELLSKELGKVECVSWYIDHNITRIFIEFPDKAEDIAKTYKREDLPVPGMMLETSDTGDSGVICTATWRCKSHRPTLGEYYARKHTGSITAADIIDAAEDTVFKSYTKLPERLCELALMEVGNPGAVIDKVVNTMMKKCLGKKRAVALADALKMEVYPEASYTAFDIAMMFMDGLIERCTFKGGASDPSIENLQKACYQVPFAKFENWLDLEGEETVVLLPA